MQEGREDPEDGGGAVAFDTAVGPREIHEVESTSLKSSRRSERGRRKINDESKTQNGS